LVCEHETLVSRTTLIVLIALGAAVASFAFSSVARTIRDEKREEVTGVAAGPQTASLGWRETYGEAGERLVFSVASLQITRDGWRARVSVENRTSIPYELGDPRATLDRSFGLMLFASDELSELEERNASNTLPAIRTATRYEPKLPKILEPGASWTGTISARGALVAGSWVRVVFGSLISVARPPPEGLDERVVWITDHAYRLRR
jgi:hypothetical protein